jgi:hypothetical protein
MLLSAGHGVVSFFLVLRSTFLFFTICLFEVF